MDQDPNNNQNQDVNTNNHRFDKSYRQPKNLNDYIWKRFSWFITPLGALLAMIVCGVLLFANNFSNNANGTFSVERCAQKQLTSDMSSEDMTFPYYCQGEFVAQGSSSSVSGITLNSTYDAAPGDIVEVKIKDRILWKDAYQAGAYKSSFWSDASIWITFVASIGLFVLSIPSFVKKIRGGIRR